jgi:hypothetical protein
MARNAYRVLGGELGEKRLLGRPARRWQHDIKMDLREIIWWYGLDSSGSG